MSQQQLQRRERASIRINVKYVLPTQNKAGAVCLSSSVLSEFFQQEYNMSLRQYTALEQGPVTNVIHWLQNMNLPANPLRCAQCNDAMDVKERNDGHVDGFHRWANKTSLKIDYLEQNGLKK